MRKTLIGFLMAATMAPPMAAFAQDARESTVARIQTEGRAERADEPMVRRQARAQQRAERRQERAEQPQRNVVVPRTQDRARTWPGQEERARRVIGEARREQRDNRREDRLERREDRLEDRVDRRQDWRGDRLDRREDRRDVRVDRRQDRRDDRMDRRQDRREDRAERRAHRRDWNRSWRNDRRYDWQRYRYSNRDAFRRGRYYSPYRHHNYSRFSIGLRLGSGFYSDRYWINDPWRYRLPPAYAGTRWVRYYDDVLLVDLFSGEVIDVIHNFFW